MRLPTTLIERLGFAYARGEYDGHHRGETLSCLHMRRDWRSEGQKTILCFRIPELDFTIGAACEHTVNLQSRILYFPRTIPHPQQTARPQNLKHFMDQGPGPIVPVRIRELSGK